MITKENLRELLLNIGFTVHNNIYHKSFKDAILKVDFEEGKLIYPEDKGLKINERQTCNFKSNENFVVFECVHRLLEKEYKPEHIELEPKWKLGHGASGGRADILVKDNSGKSLLIIECKTEGREHHDAWKRMLQNGGQLFSYVQQDRSTQFVCLYSSDFVDGKVIPYYQLVTLKDNEKLLEENKEKSPLAYKDAEVVEAIFKAWKETYQHDYATKGVFEDDIPAYKIGKTKFSVADLQNITNKDIQGKYHEFATILRQHNVSGRENAFDKLVNLFLCKIVDETQNPKELKFYWKGIAIDTFFDLQDRLQQLYQLGMKEFLGENVTYIDNSAIDEAFRFFINDPDATRDTIKKYFRELKFFTNNDFAFIDVHNEKLFYQNAAVLLKIVQMLQDIRLKTEDQHQFLGDMFEGFLDQGIKQSEGQFFTPMPIVKFILASLPLEQMIRENEQIPKVIDYACGAGHFLNEYAKQIKPFVDKHKDKNIHEYYPEVVGIEKEYRLSKVAKVSAFMYGQDEVKIVYNDALAQNSKVKEGEYAILVANPPYSVKGFLETLSESDRRQFALIDTIDEKSFTNNNSIEAFFIERAKQLLKPDGVAGIIVPSSILSKGNSRNTAKKQNVYVATREILLKYFDVVAIAEFGSGTFGKTGTNTVTLFLKRKKENPAPAAHYRNRIKAWFKNDTSKNGVFDDEHLLKQYCYHLDYPMEDYKTLLEGAPNESLLNIDTFKEYKKDFDKWSDIRNRKKQRSFKALKKEAQQAELDKRFLAYLRNIESDKLYYFILAHLTPHKVVIVKTPTDNNAKKKFLGYEWSSAKGNEGIKYLGGETITLSDIETDNDEKEPSLDEEDVRVLSNIINLNSIQTPLYDPNNLENNAKINSIINANFNNDKDKTIDIPEPLKEHVTTAKLVDMLDFSRSEFNKALSLTPKKTISIDTKWELVKLSEVAEIKNGGTPDTNNSAYWENGDICWATLVDTKNKCLYDTERKITELGLANSSAQLLPINSVLFSSRATIGEVTINKVATATNQGYKNFICDPEKIHYEYLYEILVYSAKDIESLIPFGTKYKELNSDTIKNFKIPLPPQEIQKQIVEACEAVDKEFEQAQKEIEEVQKEIESKIDKIYEGNFQRQKLSNLVEIISGGTPSTTNPRYWGGDIPWLSVADFSNNHRYVNETEKTITDLGLNNSNTKYLQKDDLIISARGTVGALAQLSKPMTFNQSCYGLRGRSGIDNGYLYYILGREIKQFKDNAYGSKFDAITIRTFDSIYIPFPDIEIQKEMVNNIETINPKIKQAQEVINNISIRKQEVIKKYL